MIPIPEYLETNAILKKAKINTITFSLHCLCGNDSFTIMENYFTRDEKAQSKPHFDALTSLMTKTHAPFGWSVSKDKSGVYHYWKYMNANKSERVEVIVPEMPDFALVSIIKAVCPNCGREIVLFDNRKHGYDGMTAKHENAMNYIPHFKQKGKTSYRIEMTIENDSSLEEFQEASGFKCSAEFYSNSFSWIRIYGIDAMGKKKKLYDYETA